MITYYISTGRGNNLYTLRCYRKFWVDLGALGGRIQEEDEYIKTLCVDSDLAIKKAKSYIDTKHSNDERKPDLKTDGATSNLYKIKRRSSEEVERIRILEEISAGIKYGIARKRNLAKWTIEAHKKLDEGINPIGYWRDIKIEEMPMKNIRYFAGLTEYKSEVHKRLSDLCKPHCKDVFEDRNKHFANIGDKVNVKAMIVKIDHWKTDFGTSISTHYITEEGEKLKTFGSCTTAFNRAIVDDYKIYDMIEFVATVKAHNSFDPTEEYDMHFGKKLVHYEGDGKVVYKSTKLIRPKLIS